VKDAATIADFVPLYIEKQLEARKGTHTQTIHGWNLLNYCLSNCDVLYLTIPASKLAYLWKAKPVEPSKSSSEFMPKEIAK
jgi:hypothetical protein